MKEDGGTPSNVSVIDTSFNGEWVSSAMVSLVERVSSSNGEWGGGARNGRCNHKQKWIFCQGGPNLDI